jgi:hypothetical protein
VKDPTPGRLHKYMEDAISVNTGIAQFVILGWGRMRVIACFVHLDIEDSHFERHHNYKLEWQPGKDGYLYWYGRGDHYYSVRLACYLAGNPCAGILTMSWCLGSMATPYSLSLVP